MDPSNKPLTHAHFINKIHPSGMKGKPGVLELDSDSDKENPDTLWNLEGGEAGYQTSLDDGEVIHLEVLAWRKGGWGLEIGDAVPAEKQVQSLDMQMVEDQTHPEVVVGDVQISLEEQQVVEGDLHETQMEEEAS